MVHALRESVRAMKPSGLLVELRPIGGMAPVEIVQGDVAQPVYEIDGTPAIPDDEASDRAVATLVDEGLIREVHRTRFLFRRYWDSVEDMHRYLIDTCSRRNIIPRIHELQVVKTAHEVAGSGARVRLSKSMTLVAYALAM